MDYQRERARRSGINVKIKLRRYLEGWDLVKLTINQDPHPRFVILQALGWGWVDFIHSIEAITLFGRGFGDLIRPVAFEGMCPAWKSLPVQNYYLVVSVFDLQKIMKTFGAEWSNPSSLAQGLLWHCPGRAVMSCQCQKHRTPSIFRRAFYRRHHDPVQVPYPESSSLILDVRGPGRLHEGGAFVFGHNVQWDYRWKDSGNKPLEEGNPSALISTPEYPVSTYIISRPRNSANGGVPILSPSGST
jgi:hypothetical protein